MRYAWHKLITHQSVTQVGNSLQCHFCHLWFNVCYSCCLGCKCKKNANKEHTGFYITSSACFMSKLIFIALKLKMKITIAIVTANDKSIHQLEEQVTHTSMFCTFYFMHVTISVLIMNKSTIYKSYGLLVGCSDSRPTEGHRYKLKYLTKLDTILTCRGIVSEPRTNSSQWEFKTSSRAVVNRCYQFPCVSAIINLGDIKSCAVLSLVLFTDLKYFPIKFYCGLEIIIP